MTRKLVYPMLLACFLISSCGIELKTIGGSSLNTADTEEEVDSKEFWDAKKETVASPENSDKPQVKEVAVIFRNEIPAGGFPYVYGGKTAHVVQPGSGKDGILACYMDGNDYSGVTVALGDGKSLDLAKYRGAGSAGLAFWAKGAPGVKSVYVGIIDDESDGKKVQTKLAMADFGELDTSWRYYMIPIRRFLDQGRYWDDNKKVEAVDQTDWKKINEIRFSVNKGENRIGAGEPVTLYVSDIAVIESIPGYVDPADYWNAFKSDAPEIMLHNFDSEKDQKWESSNGPKSEVSFRFAKSTAAKGGEKALEITFRNNDWCDVTYAYDINGRQNSERDWTKHWGLKFDFYTDKPYQPVTVQVSDAGNEIFVATTGGEKGWTEILVPFKDFSKFPYYQPADAEQNGKFDLGGMRMIDFKAAGEGTRGVYLVDNVRLTNDRKAKVKEVPVNIDVTIKGDLKKVVTEKINPGLFGINAALWDGDMLHKETAEYVKAVNHKVLRYPGGLRADEDHWKEVLSKKDFMVDIDEFLDFCKNTGTTPMITVNFGTGTAQEAADWVRHCNVTKKADVKYWEVGNELYGTWHANHCTAEEYGKKAHEFITAMKEVDPSILVTVVGVLEGDWNKTVFEQTKDVADGINVHHYPQHTGAENDAGLLSAPQTLVDILGGVRNQVNASGVPGKKYEIWLTEWNSVDFEPGPQTLSIVNGLFVADYLGMLTKINIDQASYWDIHNDVTVQGGDYGYLSRTGAPDGSNVPRPSYWAFKMASQSLGRGSLLKSETSSDNVTSYLSVDNGKKSLMIVNKFPKTTAQTVISVPGFKGKAAMSQLTAASGLKGPAVSNIDVTEGMKISLPPHSLTTITLQ